MACESDAECCIASTDRTAQFLPCASSTRSVSNRDRRRRRRGIGLVGPGRVQTPVRTCSVWSPGRSPRGASQVSYRFSAWLWGSWSTSGPPPPVSQTVFANVPTAHTVLELGGPGYLLYQASYAVRPAPSQRLLDPPHARRSCRGATGSIDREGGPGDQAGVHRGRRGHGHRRLRPGRTAIRAR